MKSLEDPQESTEGNEVSRQTDGRCFNCHQCGRVFKKKSSIVCHMRLHTGEKPFACTLCDSRFTHKSTLLHHTWLHTGEKPYECEVCHKKFRQRPHYTLHKKIHTKEKSFECPVCGKQFAQRVHLTTHNRLHTGEKPFACKECDKKFFQRCHLNRHQKIHIGEKLLEYSESDRFPSSTHLDSPILGENDQRFVQKGALLKRDEVIVDVSNINSGIDRKQAIFECDLCSKTFRRKSHLRCHISTHTGEKPFECTECGKKYCERRSVTRHAQRAHEEKSHAACRLPRERFLLVKAFPCECGSSGAIRQPTPRKHNVARSPERLASILAPETSPDDGGRDLLTTGAEECGGADAARTSAPSDAPARGRSLQGLKGSRQTPSAHHPNKTRPSNFFEQKSHGASASLTQEMDGTKTHTSSRHLGRWTPAYDVTAGRPREGRFKGQDRDDPDGWALSTEASVAHIPQAVRENVAIDALSLVRNNLGRISFQSEFDSVERTTEQSLCLSRREQPIRRKCRADNREDTIGTLYSCRGVATNRADTSEALGPRGQQTGNRPTSVFESIRSTHTRESDPSAQQTPVCPGSSQMSVDLRLLSQPGDPRLEDEVTLKHEIDIVEEDLEEGFDVENMKKKKIRCFHDSDSDDEL